MTGKHLVDQHKNETREKSYFGQHLTARARQFLRVSLSHTVWHCRVVPPPLSAHCCRDLVDLAFTFVSRMNTCAFTLGTCVRRLVTFLARAPHALSLHQRPRVPPPVLRTAACTAWRAP